MNDLLQNLGDYIEANGSGVTIDSTIAPQFKTGAILITTENNVHYYYDWFTTHQYEDPNGVLSNSYPKNTEIGQYDGKSLLVDGKMWHRVKWQYPDYSVNPPNLETGIFRISWVLGSQVKEKTTKTTSTTTNTGTNDTNTTPTAGAGGTGGTNTNDYLLYGSIFIAVLVALYFIFRDPKPKTKSKRR